MRLKLVKQEIAGRDSLRVLSVGSTVKCEGSHSLGLWCSPRKASEVTAKESAATLARRGAPGDSNDLEALVLVWLFPYILRRCSPTLLG
jgi:hypothetical protein